GVHLNLSGHYRGINELEKVGFSGRLRSKLINFCENLILDLVLNSKFCNRIFDGCLKNKKIILRDFNISITVLSSSDISANKRNISATNNIN
ncbi:hypothetical protein, partial [Acinetobacter junii]|uniref:hypothetical protein n=1 Tax=Acinetobacter junii TaxID=40215 RepID=UPI001C09CC22